MSELVICPNRDKCSGFAGTEEGFRCHEGYPHANCERSVLRACPLCIPIPAEPPKEEKGWLAIGDILSDYRSEVIKDFKVQESLDILQARNGFTRRNFAIKINALITAAVTAERERVRRELNDLLMRDATPYMDPCDREEYSVFEGIKIARNTVMGYLNSRSITEAK